MIKPYIDSSVRTFSESVNQEDLVWHRDREDRTVKSINNTDWKIQLDGELPTSLNETVNIKREVWHRLIKGTGQLQLKIIKSNI
jgi:hypothetical protein